MNKFIKFRFNTHKQINFNHFFHNLFTKKITIAKWQLNSFGTICLVIGTILGSYVMLAGIIPRIFASDTTFDWDFITSGDYTVSDSNFIEVSGSTAKLKVQNYTSDANTAALLHFDEASGNPDDSSSNDTAVTASNITYSAGKFNNAAVFNGSTAQVSIADSSALSFAQSHTLEGWVKFDNAFSANSHPQRVGIIDKGEYQLFYDNLTGKINYELAPSNADSWTQAAGGVSTGGQVNGSWDLNGKLVVDEQVMVGSDLYVGLGNAISDAEVWKWDGSAWSQIGGDGLNSSWADATYEDVWSMATDGTYLFVGLGTSQGEGEVWWCDTTAGCTSWSKIGGDAVNSSWANNTYELVTSLTVVGTNLYAGLGTTANDAEVWRCSIASSCTSWTKIGGDGINTGFNTVHEYVASMTGTGSTLYAGLASGAGDAEVWRWNGTAWTKIGGDAVNTSWADATYEIVTDMRLVGDYLYAGLGSSAQGEGEVWRCNTTTNCTAWTKVGGDGVNTSWADSTFEQVWDFTSSGDTLFAGIGNTAGDNEVWSCNGTTGCTSWSKIGGDAVNSGFTNTHTNVRSLTTDGTYVYAGLQGTATSGEVWRFTIASPTWTRIGGNYINSSWGYTNLQSVESMTLSGDYLYVGTGLSTAGNAQVWRSDGSTWTRIGGQGLNSGWAGNTYELVNSMIEYEGDLYVGIGTTANDAEVWRWNGSVWSQVGGDSLNSGWTTTFETVRSMAVYNGHLIVGLGDTAGDAEVWRYDGASWLRIGGDTINSSWANALFDQVMSLSVYGGNLYAGLGITAGEAEVWMWNGSVWAKVGGDGVNSSWNTVYEYVDSMGVYNGELYAGLGVTAGEAEVWKYNGSTWSQIGGDGLNSGWADLLYERVRNLTVYNGDLYAGLGLSQGDGEVWRWNGSSWVKVGGDSLNNGWSNLIESVGAMSVYKGKLYAGNGDTANADATIWTYGNNSVLQSTTTSQDTNWHHIAATYDGTTMRLYIDGVLDNSLTTSLTLLDTTHPVLVGAKFGGNEAGVPQGLLDGMVDEVRISTVRRTEFNTNAYSSELMTVKPNAAVLTSGVLNFDAFTVDETLNGGAIIYRLSADGGTTWQYYTGGAWTTSGAISLGNTASEVNDNIDTFPVGSSGIMWQAILDGDGTQEVTLNSVSIGALEDTTVPNAPSSVTALSAASDGTSITTDTWYGHTAPHFSWSGASDSGGSGIEGYFVYFGTDNTADPQTAGNFQAGNSYTAGSLVSGSTYYLRIKAKDRAQNVSTIYAGFIYKLDSSAPTNPSLISVSPAGYSSTNSFTFSWPSSGDGSATDVGSGIAGYQYKTGASSGDLSDWSETIVTNTITIADAAYQEGSNTFFLRSIDNGGSVASGSVQVNFYYAGDGPSAPRFLTANPSSNTTNSFAFSWQAPTTHSGDASTLTYCYTVNTLPSLNACNFTSAGATSLSADSFATQQGDNTFYVVAKNAVANGGAINYANYATATFTADTDAPGIPGNFEISDVSAKSSSSWKLALSWEAPEDIGSGIASYEVFRSTDGTTFEEVASTTGIAYVDTGLEQELTYYKVRACDSVNNCGAYTEIAELLPTGKFTEPAALSSGPESSKVTTKKATVSWTTDRASDSKVAYGTSAGSYFSEEASNSEQKTDHVINLTNLIPGTTYYYQAKWTDEDGNLGVSDEKTFVTEPSPVVTDPKVKVVGLSSVTLEYTISGASKVKIYYGETSAFGAFKEVSTSTTETTYTTTIEDLKDGAKYFYKINTVDSEASEYEGNTLSFETLPRPRVSSVRVQQVKGTAQPTILVVWSTNTEVSSIITYYPESNPGAAKDQVNVALVRGEHKMIITNLSANTPYTMYIKGRDKAGNETQSDPQRVTTATDTRPPLISNLKVEGTAIQANSANGQASAQLVVSWDTDEPSTSQVEYGEGTGATYALKTQEDANLTTNHLVVISGLTPSKVYHVRAGSKDEQNNIGNSVDTVVITPKSTESALNLVIGSLQQVFGFLGGLQQ